MGFFSGKGFVQIQSKKELTNTKQIKEFLNPETVALTMGPDPFEILVAVGDKVKIGTKIAHREAPFYVPIFASVSGTVTAIELRDHPSLKKTNHVVIENDFKEEEEPLFAGTDVSSLNTLSPEEIKERLKQLGVVGLGGAGFPAYVKFSKTDGIEQIIVNGVECEPYITSDEMGMKESSHLLVNGLLALTRAAGAKKGVIAIKEGKPELLAKLKEHASGEIEVRTVPDVYPSGWEKFLVKNLTGKDYDRLPGEVGCIVMNSSTVIEFARSLTTGLPVHTRLVTISGEGVKDPSTVRIKIGTKLAEVIEKIGGYTDAVTKDSKNSRLIAGGPLMGLPLTNDGVSIGTANNGFTSLPPTKRDELPCSRCGACVVNCPKGLQPIQILKAHKNKDTELLEKLGARECISCGICSFVCPSFIEVADAATRAKQSLLAKK